MADWTTRVISKNVEIDLHYDLESFPAQIRCKLNNESVLLNREEAHKLMLELIDYFHPNSEV